MLERETEPTAESRGMGFTARTMEVFDQRGLLPRFGPLVRARGGHFGSVPVDYAVGDSEHASVYGISQARTVAVLADWASELGADIRRGLRLEELADLGDEVVLRASDREGVRQRFTGRYLVGCDGGRSAVRRAAGFDFPGTDATAELLLADVTGLDQAELAAGGRRAGGMLLAAPIEGGLTRLVVYENGRAPRTGDDPPAFEEVAQAWQRVSGEDISHARPAWVSSFGDAARQVSEYRRGRVLLAGDAAHVHLPAGGQGMNVSIQDAVNLGWKLALVATGRAEPELLDSYHAERHPVGAHLIRNTRAQALLFLGDERSQPLRDVLADVFRGEEAARYLAGTVSGLDIRYDVGAGAHPLLGRRLPPTELVLPDGRATTSMALLQRARGVLLDFGADPAVIETAARWSDRVDVVTARPSAHGSLAGTVAVLVRPDGYVAWAGEDELASALARHFGPAADRSRGCPIPAVLADPTG
ncbi:MAG: FAD-dependent monooxygenase [Actinomycetota bacterium]|nr:FAD-dependent monooxygenase [Actinomycetota bacterium]